jgi:purine nucleosidase
MAQDWIETIRVSAARLGASVAEMMARYGRSDPCLHDPCVIAYLLEPSLFCGLEAYVEVDCLSSLSRGRTVAATAEFLLPGQAPNCTVITDVNAAKVFQLIGDRFSRF